MKAPAGAIVRIYLDLVARVGTGDIVETQSERTGEARPPFERCARCYVTRAIR